MKKLSAETDDFLKLLVYGPPGSTKTRTSATAQLDPRTAPALHLDIGGNTMSLADFENKPHIVAIDEIKDLNTIYDFFKKGQPATHAFAKYMEITEPYKTVIIDGFSSIHQFSMNLSVGQQYVEPGSIPLPLQIQNWGQVLRQVTNIANLFYKLPIHVIATALEREEKDDASGIITYSPGMGGQASKDVPAIPYNVGRLMHMQRVPNKDKSLLEPELKTMDIPDKNTVSVVWFQPSTRYMAKDQHGLGVPYIIDPTITKILDLRDRKRQAGSRYEK